VTERTTAMEEVMTPMISDATGAAGTLNCFIAHRCESEAPRQPRRAS
jgi:hypothetical protein